MSEEPTAFPKPERAADAPAELASGAERVEERKLYFDVEVAEGERTIGVGTHQRRVVATGGGDGGG